LIVSVHNYLYANPITSGSTGSPDVNRLMGSLNRGLNIPLQQIVHLSDAAAKYPRPPLKPVIEETVKNFLATTRKQDRILLFWIGHTKEIEGKMYLMPLEGEFETLRASFRFRGSSTKWPSVSAVKKSLCSTAIGILCAGRGASDIGADDRRRGEVVGSGTQRRASVDGMW
jgi:hypothetical protein